MARPEHNNNFDLVRLFAASQVLLMHAIWWLKLPPMPEKLAWAITALPGVPIFFCISGFLVTQSYINCKGNLVDFYTRRGLRIYPGLWVHFLFIVLLLLIGGTLSFGNLFSGTFLGWLVASFVFGSDFYGFYFAGSPFSYEAGFYKNFPSGVLWTISVELGFYVLTPLALVALSRRRWVTNLVIALWAVASIVTAMIIAANAKVLPNASVALFSCLPFSYFWMFLIGAALCVNWDRVQGLVVGRAWFWLPLYIGVSYADAVYRGVSVLDYQKLDLVIVFRMCLLAVATISVAYTLRGAARVLRGNDLSYGIYLYHMPVVMTLLGFGFVGSAWLYAAVPVVTVILAAASWLIVERRALAQRSNVSGYLNGLIGRLPVGRIALPPGRLGPVAGVGVSSIAAVFMAVGFWNFAAGHQVDGLVTEQVYSLDRAVREQHWQAFPGVEARADAAGIAFRADDSKYGYQIGIKDIPVQSGQSYLLNFSVAPSAGKLGVGVIDGTTGQWITTVADVQASLGVVRFTAPSDKVQIIVFNNKPEPVQSNGTISVLTLSRVGR